MACALETIIRKALADLTETEQIIAQDYAADFKLRKTDFERLDF